MLTPVAKAERKQHLSSTTFMNEPFSYIKMREAERQGDRETEREKQTERERQTYRERHEDGERETILESGQTDRPAGQDNRTG